MISLHAPLPSSISQRSGRRSLLRSQPPLPHAPNASLPFRLARQRQLLLNALPEEGDQIVEEVMDPKVPPTAWAVNVFCLWVLGLLFLIDFTPAGSLLSGGADLPLSLAAIQYGLFLLPTLISVRNGGWDLTRTFRLRGVCAAELLAALTGGYGAYALVTALELSRGNILSPTATTASIASSFDGFSLAPFLLLAIAPAVAEELLFRGLFLSSILQRFGRYDAVALSAAGFALIHLEPSGFFRFAVLGGAAGLAATSASESVWLAVLLHATYNASALVLGSLIHDPSDPRWIYGLLGSGAVGMWTAVGIFLKPKEQIPCAGGEEGFLYVCDTDPEGQKGDAKARLDKGGEAGGGGDRGLRGGESEEAAARRDRDPL